MIVQKLIALVLFIIAFAALICIHEAGHLSMAKLFKVYCKEYSIGFGPAIISKKKEGHETTFSIRWVPLGGYVSMYGEEGMEEDDPAFKDIPAERSLEGVKKWKKAIIVSAGVILNAILALVLIGVSNFAFPVTQMTRNAIVAENSLIAEAGIKENDVIQYYLPDEMIKEDGIYAFTYDYTDEKKTIHADTFYIVDPNVQFENGDRYVLTFMFAGDKKEPVFTEGANLYKAISKADLASKEQSNKLFSSWASEEGSPEYYPLIEDGIYKLQEETKFNANLRFKSAETQEIVEKTIGFSTKSSGRKYVLKDIGLSFHYKKFHLSGKEKLSNTFADFGSASSAVFRGLKVLFTGGIKNLSGFVGILDTSATIYTSYTFATYLYFWGLISINLAIFNLLPFPGLDGWQLLVTAVEGISKKKLPNKFKTVMSLIGLALLFALMAVIVVLDIIRIVRV